MANTTGAISGPTGEEYLVSTLRFFQLAAGTALLLGVATSVYRAWRETSVVAPRRQNALAAAISRQDVSAVQQLLRAGARVNAIVEPPTTDIKLWGNTPLNIAILRSNPVIVRLLLQAGANADGGRERSSPLLIAVGKQDLQSAQLLLEAGANPNVEACWQLTPLGLAREHRHWKMTQLLRSFGAYR